MSNSFSRFCHLKDLPSGLYIVRRNKLRKSPLFGEKKKTLSTLFKHIYNLHAL